MHDYWIGDRVWVAGISRKGIYEGLQSDGVAKVKIEGTHQFFPLDQIYLLEEDAESLQRLTASNQPKKYQAFTIPVTDSVIDLHITKLNPALEQAPPQQILAFQLRACREFMDKAIHSGLSEISIIHGKGNGALRAEVRNLVLSIDNDARLFLINEEGASKVMLSH